MKKLNIQECIDVTGAGVILIVGGAFLAGVVGGYISSKTEAFLNGMAASKEILACPAPSSS